MSGDIENLVNKHPDLVHSDMRTVLSHVQRVSGEWMLHTLMIVDCDAPFKFKRRRSLKSLKGQRVNLTYYRTVEVVAGIEVEVMNVVRVRRS